MRHATGCGEDGRRARRAGGFTLVELLVVIGIIAVLAAIIMPVYSRARENARQAMCTSNLVNVGRALRMYYDDYHGYPMPYTYDFNTGKMVGGLACLYYARYFDDYHALRCPDDSDVRNIDEQSRQATGNPDISYSSYNRWYNFYGMWGRFTGFAFDASKFPSPPGQGEQATLVEWLNNTYLPSVAAAMANPGMREFALGEPLLFLGPNKDLMAESSADLAARVFYPEFSGGSGRQPVVDELTAPLWNTPGPTSPPYGMWSGVFPGLCNRSAPDSTVATHCGWHRSWFGGADKARDLVLTLNGSVTKELVTQYDWIRQKSLVTE